jgi:hypothetical protein
MTVDVARLRAGLAAVEAAALVGTWDQGTWRAWSPGGPRCGTVKCFAGWVAEINGGRWLNDPPVGDQTDDQLIAEESEPGAVLWSVVPADTWTVNARSRARSLLGLSSAAADLLFDGGNSLPTLRFFVAAAALVAEDGCEDLLGALNAVRYAVMHPDEDDEDIEPEPAAGGAS